jgi:aerobic-type carbon monoxide dehydrogenase small subunit (CoxS/CutS family)
MPEITLRVNGSERKVSVAPQTPPLWVLRNTLQLTGTKFVCGAGLCGACIVLVEGTAVRSSAAALQCGVGRDSCKANAATRKRIRALPILT